MSPLAAASRNDDLSLTTVLLRNDNFLTFNSCGEFAKDIY
jgi:hypothetical protein